MSLITATKIQQWMSKYTLKEQIFVATHQLILLSNKFDNTRSHIQVHRMFSLITYGIPHNNAKLISNQHTFSHKMLNKLIYIYNLQYYEVYTKPQCKFNNKPSLHILNVDLDGYERE